MALKQLFICNIKGHDGSWYITSSTMLEGLDRVIEAGQFKDFSINRELAFKTDAAKARRFSQNLMHAAGKTLNPADVANSGVCPVTTFYASDITEFVEFLTVGNSLPQEEVVRQWYKKDGNGIIKTGTHPDNIEQTKRKNLDDWLFYMTKKYGGQPTGTLVLDNGVLYQVSRTETGKVIFRKNVTSG